MKNAMLAFAAGSALTFALGAYTQESSPQGTQATQAIGPMVLTVHDAGGRTFVVSAVYNSMSIDGTSGLTVDYDSDQFLCSGFGN